MSGCNCGGWSACPRCGVVELPRRFVGHAMTVRDGLVSIATGDGLVWVRPVGPMPRPGTDVDLRGFWVALSEVRREAQARAA